MRGKPAAFLWAICSKGITPADAGKTKTEKGEPKKEQDHPRGCGENLKVCVLRHTHLGSPPRMRGKHYNNTMQEFCIGITPADAGKTWKFFFHSPEL